VVVVGEVEGLILMGLVVVGLTGWLRGGHVDGDDVRDDDGDNVVGMMIVRSRGR